MPITPTLIPGSPILLVGEAPGKSEEMMGRPFVGSSGQELDHMLGDSGINRNCCSLTNVFLDRPDNNDLKKWMIPLKQGGVGTPIQKGKYFNAERYKERDRLYAEIERVAPNIVIALGNTATWALLDKTGISSVRGVISSSKYVSAKILPTYHPAAVMRQYDLRSTTIVDLMKAQRESHYPEIRFPALRAIIEPSLQDIQDVIPQLLAASLMSYDIETANSQITCIGFGIKGLAITIPFVSYQHKDRSYWNQEEEIIAWKLVRHILNSSVRKVTQNGLYDIQYLDKYGIHPRNSFDDTMLLHHSMMPELPKSLGFLGSVYTNFPSWKGMRPKGIETNKKEE